MLSLYKLEIFAAVVDAGSFSAAAERLLMTQPAVSQHMQDLEFSLGAQLFNRGRRGVTLTPAGEALQTYTLDILRLVAEAEIAVTDVDHLSSGQVSIGATPGVSVYLLPDWMQNFRARYRNLKATLQTGVTQEIVEGVLNHRLDIGFIEGELVGDESPRLGQLVLQEVRLYVIVGPDHSWWDQPAVPMSLLTGQPMVTRQLRSKTRTWIDQILQQHGVQPDIVAELDNPESIKRVVATGMGIAILPDYATSSELESGTLRAISIRDVPLRRTLKLVWNTGIAFPPVTRAFLAHLTGQFPHVMTVL